MEKIYVLDTNVLLHDPLALQVFQEHRVVVPMTVLEELDVIKDRREKDVSREARIAINAIDGYLGDASPSDIVSGVALPDLPNGCSSGTLAVYPDQAIKHSELNVNYLNVNIHHANDNRIINVALTLQSQNPGAYVCLVTKDINMRLKGKGSGLEHVEDYRNDKVLDDIDLLAKGYEQVSGSFWDTVGSVTTAHEDGFTVHTVKDVDIASVHPNMFITDEEGFVGVVLSGDQNEMRLVQYSHDFLNGQCNWGIQPRNAEQAKAMYLLDQEDIDLTVLTGPAGSGKTLLALAYGLEEIMENKSYDKMIIARSTPPLAEDIGFLPGTEEEKMAPWLAAFDDNLEVLIGADGKNYTSMDYVKERANIQFKSLSFMRGRSFNNAFIIVDEAQNLTQFQIKSILTRVGKNSKIVVLGNLAQIDNKYLTPLTSGLTYLVEKCKYFEHAGVMRVNGIERSRLAAFAEENL